MKDIDSYENFNELTSEQKNDLTKWINNNLSKINNFNTSYSSYELKHAFFHEGGFDMNHGAFKGAMLECGFKVKNKEEIKWYFNISKKSINDLKNKGINFW